MTEQNALSRRQFAATGFYPTAYEFVAVIDCKRWGKGKKLVTYMTFDDGRRIVAPTWPRSHYEGLANIESGSRIRIGFVPNKREPCVSAA